MLQSGWDFIKAFLNLESASGLILMFMVALAMLAANSPTAEAYEALRQSPLSFWVNDGLMAIFFLVVGIEIKREMVEGELATVKQALLPVVAALSGVALPALIYTCFNHHGPFMRGWAIPSATDIAFSLGVLALLGERVGRPLKIFLMSVAVIDDLVAVIIIASFYTSGIALLPLVLAVMCAGAMFALNRLHNENKALYLLLTLLLWVAMLKSGVHPTIAGVCAGFLMPLEIGKALIHALHAWVAYAIVPLFAFLNGGISLAGLTIAQVLHPVTLGIALGLFIGKQAGIFTVSCCMVRLGLAQFPAQTGRLAFFGVSLLTGIGFTMSLFIGALAFSGQALLEYTRLGVIMGSLLSAVVGYSVMRVAVMGKTE